ncbi:MAG: IS66 family transposase [Bdellovibrionales bacterium]|nr:IS66 family transposase [Bdellovibrionales bacterium]
MVKIELPENERFSEEGQPLKVIGWEFSEKLKYEPAKVSVIRYERAKYGVDSGDYVKTAPPVPSVIPKGVATPELLAFIMTSKYCDGLPLYRIEEIMDRQGVDLPRSTMARWVVQVAQALVPVWNVLSDRLLASFYVAVDETQVQVLKENGRKAGDKSWMWVRSTPYGDKKIVLFDYRISWSQEAARQLLDGITGYLQ